jgi:tetratricopeptide (TPR) repeat protein
LLHVEEEQAFLISWQREKVEAAAVAVAATGALRRFDATSPLLGFALGYEARMLVWQRRLDEARRALGEAEAILEAHPRSRALRLALLVRRATIESAAGDLEQAIAAYRSALELPGSPQDPQRAWIGTDLGAVLERQGEYEEAAEWCRRALVLEPRTAREKVVLAGANNRLGLLSKQLGDFERAERYYQNALELYPEGGVAEAGIRTNLGNLAQLRGDFETAEATLRKALDLRLALQPGSPAVASSYHNLGVALRKLGQLEAAAAMLEKALAIKEESVPESLLTATTLEELAQVKLKTGDTESAAELISRACAISRALAPDTVDFGRCTLLSGNVAVAAGRREQAMELWREGLAVVEKLRERVPSEQGKARFSAMFDAFYRNLACGYLEEGDTVRGFLTLESARARMLRALLQQYGDRAALAASPKLLEARRRQDAEIERTLGHLASLHPVTDAEKVREIHLRLRALESEREEINERLYRSARGLERIERISPISLERIRRALPVGSAGLFYSVGTEHTDVFVVRSISESPGLETVTLDLGRADVEARIDIFRSLLERGRDGGVLEPAVVEQGHRLYEDLLAPLADKLESVSRLYVAPDAALAELPFAALVRSREPLRFIAEWLPHAVVPSLGSLVELREEARPRGGDAELRPEMAGCETGRGAEWKGEGLIGLAQAFHYVGTPAVLASQWRVGDAWVGELTSAFYGELLAGREPMVALAAAQRQMIATSPGPDGASRSHPYYWEWVRTL